MNEFIESLKRLYASHKINDDVIKQLYTNKKITEKELRYILGKEDG
jgi:hypothetical protein